ncbi:MAG TPA: hypothetical protein VJT70_00705 [Sphingomicrobium sp.]|nr:hypothetical protein [Sphingomicrobium sp.]
MNMTSEQVHWVFGAGLVLFSLAMLVHAERGIKSRWPEFLVAGALLVAGLALIFDPLLHGMAAPKDYAAETAQHIGLGLLLLAGSGAEFYRMAKRRRGLVWRLPICLILLAASAAFFTHAQHGADVPMLVLVAQHRFIGATLLVMAIGGLLSSDKREGAPGPAPGLLTLLLGLELLLYTEGRSLLGTPHGGHAAMAEPTSPAAEHR